MATRSLPGQEFALDRLRQLDRPGRPQRQEIIAISAAKISPAFVGDRQRVSIVGAAAKTLIADISNAIQIKAGDRVGLSIDPAAILLLPEDPA